MGPVSFGGGGGDWGLLPKYFLHRLPQNQVVLPEYDLLFTCKWSWEGGGVDEPLPSPTSYAYDFITPK